MDSLKKMNIWIFLGNKNKTKNITGTKFGRLTAIELIGKKNGRYVWLCLCECGNYKKVTNFDLKKGNTKSCGCLRKEITSKRFKKDLRGKKFGRLTAIGYDGKDDYGKYLYNCKCECGGSARATATHLLSGHTRSCGCLNKELIGEANKTHGLTKSIEYSTWANMKSRCLNKKATEYKRYGSRGIKICERWINSFEKFYADMGVCPEGFSIERINNNGNYTPENCKWADVYEQANNKRNNFIVQINGGNVTLSQAERLIGIGRNTIRYRAINGLPLIAKDLRYNANK